MLNSGFGNCGEIKEGVYISFGVKRNLREIEDVCCACEGEGGSGSNNKNKV